MATHSLPLLPPLLLLLSAFSVPVPRSSAAAAATSEAPFCPRSDLAFVGGLIAQCPRWIELSFPWRYALFTPFFLPLKDQSLSLDDIFLFAIGLGVEFDDSA
ncbi:hypothetical protein C4D60_Mb04t18430 [Musa balbisiana]|uniref:Secreted protein n=1 Tax=Musa balbisiana TaxID=52838 RepID=A0A4S8KCY5_MUSBA|nr:hypothetical protein C4D60_Mb04t18430 [Musa balbisiana]